MKFQYLAVIFVIIILPISLVLSFYAQTQIDIVNKQTNYTSKLNDATYDAVKAFQLNTTNNYYSSVSDSKIRDIEASVNTFYNSLTTSFNYTKEDLEAFIPAIVYTLYDGYYIYGKRYNAYEVSADATNGKLASITIDTKLDDPNKYEYGLKSFVYYSCRYKDSNNDFVVNFTLDNFISIYGMIDNEYVTKSGYLVSTDSQDWGEVDIDTSKKIGEQVKNITTYKGAKIEEKEELKEYLKFSSGESAGILDGEYAYVVYQSQKIYKDNNRYFWYDQGKANIINNLEIINAVKSGETTSGKQYYIDALNFSKWVTEKLGSINYEDHADVDKNEFAFDSGKSPIFDMSKQDPENPSSTFNQHRIAVIKNSIVTNLITAINSYNSNANSYAYSLPKLTEEDWEKVVNNVCVISFMQGLPMGGKYFNNYVVIPNDPNNEFVDIDSVYLLTSDGQYHMPNCPLLVEDKNYQSTIGKSSTGELISSGYINTSFVRQTTDENYYYKHVQNKNAQKPYTACYHCIVNASGKYDLENDIFRNTTNKIGANDITTLRNKYLTVLAREKYNLYKINIGTYNNTMDEENNTNTGEEKVPVTSITINKTNVTLYIGETTILTTTIGPSSATNKSVTWSSSNPSIATIDSNGKVTAKMQGTTTITATAKDASGITATCTIIVKEREMEVTSIKINPSSLTLYEQETATITATIEPSDATNKNVTWSSSNPSIATVDNNGNVTAIAEGKTTITATAKDASGITATCQVTVKKKLQYLADVVKVGDYVAYTANGYSNWRVMSVTGSGSTGIVTLISAGNATKLTVGALTTKNYINKLNDTSKKYINSEYATSARSVGTTSSGGNNSNYGTEINNLKNNELLVTESGYWIGYHETKSGGIFTDYIAYYINEKGNCEKYNNSNIFTPSQTKGVRPIVTLKQGILQVDGNGSASNPYSIKK